MATDGKKRKKKKVILPTDPMAEAGRKIFAQQIRRMKSHEAGSRTGEDISNPSIRCGWPSAVCAASSI